MSSIKKGTLKGSLYPPRGVPTGGVRRHNAISKLHRAAFGCPLLAVLVAGCAHGPPNTGANLQPDETAYLDDLRQLTFGGENAEAYWSFDGTQLSFQSRQENEGCDRIYTLSAGRITGEVPRAEATQEGLMTLMTAGQEARK